MNPHPSESDCKVAHVIEFFSGRWKLQIVFWLLQGPYRFNALQRQLGPITHRTLSRQLTEMMDAGLVIRTDFKTVPPHVEYSLTPMGHSLIPVLEVIRDWAGDHADDLKMSPKHPLLAVTESNSL
jgi:DNA-binding HxlR family transcriptional regulator